jgi:predicted transposase YbfD/YdcC
MEGLSVHRYDSGRTIYRPGREVRRWHFVSSSTKNTEQLLHAARTYWGIENKMHRVLNIAFREDDSRLRERKLRPGLRCPSAHRSESAKA